MSHTSSVRATEHLPWCSPGKPLRPAGFHWRHAAVAPHLIFAVLNGASIADPEPVHVASDPQKWAYGQSTSVNASVSLHVLHECYCSIGYLSVWLVTSAATQQPWRACVRRVLRGKLACVVPLPSLDPRLASRTFAVSKDENRCKFLGDRRPMNSLKRSIGRAHLLHCSRLRCLILGTSETIQKDDVRHQGQSPLARSARIACVETRDRASHHQKLANRLERRMLGCAWLITRG